MSSDSLKSFEAMGCALRKREEVEARREAHEKRERKRAAKDNAVLAGVFRPEPVNKSAAMLLAKASWLAKDPAAYRPQPKEEKNMGSKVEQVVTGPDQNDEKLIKQQPGMRDDLLDMNELARRVTERIEKNTPKELNTLARSVANARGVLDDAIHNIGYRIEEFERVTKVLSSDIRATRMNTVTETSAFTRSLKDIRQFFLGPDYDREVQRLEEFVGLCERLRTLKEDGVLDAVADTMLQLALPKD